MTKSDQKPKLLYVITKSNFGGAQKYLYALADTFSNSGFDVSVALGGTVAGNAATGVLAEKLRAAHIRVIPIESMGRDVSLINDIRTFFALISLFRVERPDVVHLNSSKAIGLGSLAARIAEVKKIVITVHGWALGESRPAWQKALIWLASSVTCICATDIIAISQKTFDESLSYPTAKAKLHLIYNGIESPEFLSREDARNALGLPGDVLFAGTIAELTHNKNIRTALDAVARVPHLHFAIIGDGELRKELEGHATRLDIHHRVHFLGFRDNAARYLKAFDVFLLSSIKEGLPYVLLEAGHASLPVVATRVGSIPEIIEDGVTGFLCSPDNVKEMTDLLLNVTSNTERAATTGAALLETTKERFSVNQMEQKTRHVYGRN